MNFLIFNERGEITQSNKVYEPSGYGEILRNRGLQFIEVDSADPLHMNDYYISRGHLTGRPELPCFVHKTDFKADGNDAAIITGLPNPCRVTVLATGGIVVADNELVDTGFIELPSIIPTTYSVKIDAWPYRSKQIEVRAHEA